MANAFVVILITGIAILGVMAVIGLVRWIQRCWRREKEGDIFLMRSGSAGTGSEPPLELRVQRDLRYKDADVDPYEKKE